MKKLIGSLKSRTMWFGVVIIALVGLQENAGAVTALVGDEIASKLLYGVGIAIMALRWVTGQSLDEKAEQR